MAIPVSERPILKPQPGPQTEFLASPASITFFGGGSGGGKTYALLFEFLRNINHQNFTGVIFRRTAEDITKPGGLWASSNEIYPLVGGVGLQSELRWTFPSGANITFAGMKDEKDRLKWQGTQLPYIAFDEGTHFTAPQFWYMPGRNRSTTGIPGRMRVSCNPDPDSFIRELLDWWIDHDGYAIKERSGKLRWFVRRGLNLEWANTREELVERFGPDEEPKSLTFIPSTIYDNKILLEKDPSYLSNLKALSHVDRMQLLECNWNVRACAGSFFKREWFGQPVAAVPVAGIVGRIRFWDRACFIAGTKVETSNGKIPIEEIKAGDMVLTRKGFKRVKWAGETKIAKEITTVKFSNGESLSGTPDHRIWTQNRGWVALAEISRGDYCLGTCNSTLIPLKVGLPNHSQISSAMDAESFSNPEKAEHHPNIAHEIVGITTDTMCSVFDLQVEDCHEFFANGVLVHNSTEKTEHNDPDQTCSLLMSKAGDGRYYIEHYTSMFATPYDVDRAMKRQAEIDGPLVTVGWMRDPASAGKKESSDTAFMMSGYPLFILEGARAQESKMIRAKPVSSQCQAGNVKILRGPWNDRYLRNLEAFPEGRYLEEADITSGAFTGLNSGPAAVQIRTSERERDYRRPERNSRIVI